MIQRGQQLRFTPESCHPLRVSRKAVGKNLQRHVAAELRVPRSIDLAHPARSQRFADLVVSDRTANPACSAIRRISCGLFHEDLCAVTVSETGPDCKGSADCREG